jgi:predicted Zn-dependent protease
MKFISFLLIFSLISSCSKAPISGKRGFFLTSERQENQIGEKAYNDILSKEKKTKRNDIAQGIRQVGINLSRVARRPDYKWEFNTLESEQPNAFCLPGGKIAIYTGILKYTQNEAGLAAVMGHEIGHALARHGGQRMSMAQVTGVGLALAGAVGAAKYKGNKQKQSLLLAALGAGVGVGVTLPFSRSNESEADEIGLILMARAGYDPREAVRFWERFSKMGGKKPPEFLSTHPSSTRRARNLEKLIPKAMEVYNQTPVKYGIGKRLM